MEEENDDYAPHICFSDAEDIQFYGAGGFHPTHIGDKFDNNRYEIVHKLGYGASATVWLALDHTDHRLVALKIIAADLFDRTWEVNALEALAAGEQDHPGRRAVPKLLKRFDIQGPNGHHHCLVLEVAGCNLIQSMRVRAPWQFPLDVARAMVSELIQGLDYIHSCGVVHGDMHLKNFLLFSPVFDKDSADVEQLYNHVGTPITVPVRRANGIINLPSAPFYSPNVPRYCVPPIEAHRPADSVTNAKIVINDFSRSFPQRERHAVRTPVRFLAPETMFEGVSGQPADVWGLACSIFEILGDFHLFPVYGDDWDELIMMMIRTIGWIPDDWWNRWTTRGNYFRDDGTFIRPTRFFPTRFWVGLGVRIVTMRLSPHPGQVAFGREEIDALEDMLKGMMRYRPWHRSTASEAAASRWMQEWSRVGYFNGH